MSTEKKIINCKGLDVKDVQMRYPEIDFRVTKEDGESYLVTQELKPDRYNFHIEKGKIVYQYLG